MALLLLQLCIAELLSWQRRCAQSPGRCTPATCIPGDMLVLPAAAQPKRGAGWAHHRSLGGHVGWAPAQEPAELAWLPEERLETKLFTSWHCCF